MALETVGMEVSFGGRVVFQQDYIYPFPFVPLNDIVAALLLIQSPSTPLLLLFCSEIYQISKVYNSIRIECALTCHSSIGSSNPFTLFRTQFFPFYQEF